MRVAMVAAIALLFPHTGGCERLGASEFFVDPSMILLAQAVQAGDLESIEELVAGGAPVNTTGERDETLLVWALRNNQKAAFRKLLQLGADPNLVRGGSGNTVVHLVSASRDSAWLEMALEFGGDVNRKNRQGDSPLFIAIGTYARENVHLLLSAGARLEDRNSVGETPVLYAASFFQYDLVLRLLEGGASYSAADNRGRNLATVVAGDIPADPELARARQDVIAYLERHGVYVESTR